MFSFITHFSHTMQEGDLIERSRQLAQEKTDAETTLRASSGRQQATDHTYAPHPAVLQAVNAAVLATLFACLIHIEALVNLCLSSLLDSVLFACSFQ